MRSATCACVVLELRDDEHVCVLVRSASEPSVPAVCLHTVPCCVSTYVHHVRDDAVHRAARYGTQYLMPYASSSCSPAVYLRMQCGDTMHSTHATHTVPTPVSTCTVLLGMTQYLRVHAAVGDAVMWYNAQPSTYSC